MSNYLTLSLYSQNPNISDSNQETDMNVVYDPLPVSVYYPPHIYSINETHQNFIANMFPLDDKSLLTMTDSTTSVNLGEKLSRFSFDKAKKTTNICSEHVQERFGVIGKKRKSALCCCLKLSNSMDICSTCPKPAKRSCQSSNDECSSVTQENRGLLSGDDWKIKKLLTHSDVNNSCRLLIGKHLVKKHILPRLWNMPFDLKTGLEIPVRDVDTQTDHVLTFITWSTDSFLFKKNWSKDFVHRRSLEDNDQVGLRWAKDDFRLEFSVLRRNNPFLIA